MTELHCTLLSDGSSDRALIPILRWLLHHLLPHRPVQLRWADLRQLPQPPRPLSEKIITATQLYPCDLLLVHRDAENASIDERQAEVDSALNGAQITSPGVAVIPVRMMEAWLLIDEAAIRIAANNPNGHVPLNMPTIDRIENLNNPKTTLHNLLIRATELQGRRKRRFNVYSAVHRIPEYIDDFSSLRCLSAFTCLEKQIDTIVCERGWATELSN